MTKKHYSDCAVHNEPAYPKGDCDCGGYEDVSEIEVLRSKNEYQEIVLDKLDMKNAKLRAENANLRDLLDNALGWLGWYDHIEEHMPLMSVDSIRAARTALGDQHEN